MHSTAASSKLMRPLCDGGAGLRRMWDNAASPASAAAVLTPLSTSTASVTASVVTNTNQSMTMSTTINTPSAGRTSNYINGNMLSTQQRMASSSTRLWRWGATSSGGPTATKGTEMSTTPTLVEGITSISSIACGKDHSSFLADGSVYTFGKEEYGKLGRKGDAAALEKVGDLDDIVQLSNGDVHSCALDSQGNLYSWGWGGSFFGGAGALGLGENGNKETPQVVETMDEPVKYVSCGEKHTVALSESGKVYTTGAGDYGLQGRGNNSDTLEFELVEYFEEVRDTVLQPEKLGSSEPYVITKVKAGKNFTAALTDAGELFVWGRNDHGQLGLDEQSTGDVWASEKYPTLVRSLATEGHRVIDFACGDTHINVLTDNGQFRTWGNRMWAVPYAISLPRQFENGIKEDFTKMVAGDRCSMALTESGRVFVWGQPKSNCLAGEFKENQISPAPLDPRIFQNQKVIDIAVYRNRCLAVTDESEFIPDDIGQNAGEGADASAGSSSSEGGAGDQKMSAAAAV